MSNILDNLTTGVKVMFSNFTDAQRAEVKALIAGLETPAAAAPAAVQMKETKTKDGKMLSYDGELIEGIVINEVTEAGAMPLVSGDYEMEDGTMVTIGEGGKVTAIKKVEAPAADPSETVMPQMAQAVQQMEAKFSAHKTEVENKYSEENKALKAEIEKLSGAVKMALSTIDKMLEAPVNTVDFSKAKAAKKYEEMTASEKYNHDHPIA